MVSILSYKTFLKAELQAAGMARYRLNSSQQVHGTPGGREGQNWLRLAKEPR